MRSDKTRFLTESGQNLPRCSEFRASRRLLVHSMGHVVLLLRVEADELHDGICLFG